MITPPPNPAAAKQELTITDVYSGTVTVTLEMFNQAGTKIAGTFTGSGTTRTFTPTADWASGSNTVKVVQTVGGVASDPSELCTFTVQPAKPPKPAIIPPPDPAAAKQELTITNVAPGTVTLEMFNQAGTKIAGTFTGSGTTRIFMPTAEWAPGSNTVKVVQTVNGVASDPSDECTFTVEEAKPETPQFELPLAGSNTSTRPTIRVSGLPLAQMTVRLEGADTLLSGPADTEGVLEFVAEPPLAPGANALEVKQKGDGPESDWSEPRRFTVKEPPQKPEIYAPANGSPNPRKPTIRGKGETRGQIVLCHEDDPENPIGTVKGVSSWRWTAKDSWDLGEYSIRVRQTDDGDSSSWSEPRSFKVVDARYGISDAGPVLSQPVVDKEQSVRLRVQVKSGVTGEVAEGMKVDWRIKGKQDVIATTETGPDGWTQYRYTPGTAGIHEVLADITDANQGVVMTEPFTVIALLEDAWEREVELYLNGVQVDWAKKDLVLLRGKPCELELKVHSDSVLIGSSVTLQDLWEAAELGLKFHPNLGEPQSIEEGQSVRWLISFDGEHSGFFGLNLTSPLLPDWHLPGQVEA